jgi:chromosome partitioning protein
MQVVTLLNQKGGVGKTSCTHHLSGALAASGRRVLVVDADPQASLTQGWWGPVATEGLDPSSTVASILAGDMPHPSRVVHPTGADGISIVPGSIAAEDFNHPRPLDGGRAAVTTIREFMAEVEGFDFALIDCPPNLCGCAVSAMAASDFLVVPVQPEDYGSQGIARVMRCWEEVRAHGFPVELAGVLLTMVSPRRALHQAYEASIRQEYGDAVFAARMPELPDFPEAIALRKTVAQYKPKGAAAKAVKAIAEELIERAAKAEAEGQGVAA